MHLFERLVKRFQLDEVIQKCNKEDKRDSNDAWCVYSQEGKLLGRASNKEQARKRLREIEYFKHKKG